jgi:hypothetical protein
MLNTVVVLILTATPLRNLPGTIIVPNLQTRVLLFRELRKLDQEHTVTELTAAEPAV